MGLGCRVGDQALGQGCLRKGTNGPLGPAGVSPKWSFAWRGVQQDPRVQTGLRQEGAWNPVCNRGPRGTPRDGVGDQRLLGPGAAWVSAQAGLVWGNSAQSATPPTPCRLLLLPEAPPRSRPTLAEAPPPPAAPIDGPLRLAGLGLSPSRLLPRLNVPKDSPGAQ